MTHVRAHRASPAPSEGRSAHGHPSSKGNHHHEAGDAALRRMASVEEGEGMHVNEIVPGDPEVAQARAEVSNYILAAEGDVSTAMLAVVKAKLFERIPHEGAVLDAVGENIGEQLTERIAERVEEIVEGAEEIALGPVFGCIAMMKAGLDAHFAGLRGAASVAAIDDVLRTVSRAMRPALLAINDHVCRTDGQDMKDLRAAIDLSLPLVDAGLLAHQITSLIAERERASGTMTVAEQVDQIRALGGEQAAVGREVEKER